MSQYSLFHKASGTNYKYQETTAPTVTASAVWLQDTLQNRQENVISWYAVKNLLGERPAFS